MSYSLSTSRLPVSSDSARASSARSRAIRSATRASSAARSIAGVPGQGPSSKARRAAAIGGQGVGAAGLGDRGDQAPVGGTADLPLPARRGFAPLAADQQILHRRPSGVWR